MRFLLLRVLVTIAISVLSANAAVTQIVTDGLVGFWSLDESSIVGETVKDMWGDNDGVMIGAPEVVDGRINQALSFNGEDNLVEIGHSESLNLVEAITIEFWFLLTGDSLENQYPRAVGKGQSTVENGAYGVWIVDTRGPVDIGFRCITLAPTDIRSQELPDYNDGAWHHIAVTYDGQAGKLYLDGVNYVDIPVTGEISQTEDPLHIGDGNNERHFKGAIDEFRIYSRALGEAEILQNFGAELNIVTAVSASIKLPTLWGQLKSQ